MEPPIADTGLGKYRGHYLRTINGRTVCAFNGIRYAKPPLDQLRFKDPVKIEAHEGVADATADGDDCLQVKDVYNKYTAEEMEGKEYVGSEDCLFLNVYTPQVKPSKLLPVMIFIHGGGYYKGTCSTTWHGPHMLLDKDVVLVTITYRLGIFGFLSVDDEVLPGNQGLKDQSLGIHWVKEHIASFGGDPANITLTGNSAGSASAQLHMLSPWTRDVIQRVICQSATHHCPWAMIKKEMAREIALGIATFLKCPTTPKEMRQCLQSKTALELMQAATECKKNADKQWFVQFAPVLESKAGGFITAEDLERGSETPWMTGVTSDEGFLFYRETYRRGDAKLEKVNEELMTKFPLAFHYKGHPRQDEITLKIKQFYFGQDKISDQTLHQYINMLTDGIFLLPTIKCLRTHRGPSYFYLFSHVGQRTLTAELPVSGACHADELFYLYPFSKTSHPVKLNQTDTQVQQMMVRLWTNFAIHGTPSGGEEGCEWPESNKGEMYADLSAKGLQLQKNIYPQRLQFWDQLSKTYSI